MFGQMRSSRRSRCCYCKDGKCQCDCHKKLTKYQRLEKAYSYYRSEAWAIGIVVTLLGFLIGMSLGNYLTDDPMKDKECSLNVCEFKEGHTSTGASYMHNVCTCEEWRLKK